jgi:hypothetical protein
VGSVWCVVLFDRQTEKKNNWVYCTRTDEMERDEMRANQTKWKKGQGTKKVKLEKRET